MKIICFLGFSLLCSVCKTHVGEISHLQSFQAVEVGNSVTITCWISKAGRHRVWYKLTTESRLQPVASTDTVYNLTTFNQASLHYDVRCEHLSSHLTITSTTWEDAGTYYCGVMNFLDIEFESGTFLIITGANVISSSVIQQPQSESVPPGASVTLSCSVHSDHCTAEHTRVTWLKSSNRSDLEIVHASEDVNSSCHRTNLRSTCVYNVLLRNLGSDEAGTYYCAVNSCGQMQFGNGTKVNVHNVDFTKPSNLSPAVIALVLSNVVWMVTLLLLWSRCKNNKDPAATQPSGGSPESCQTEVVYAAVCAATRSSSCRPAPLKHSEDSGIYSDIKQ